MLSETIFTTKYTLESTTVPVRSVQFEPKQRKLSLENLFDFRISSTFDQRSITLLHYWRFQYCLSKFIEFIFFCLDVIFLNSFSSLKKSKQLTECAQQIIAWIRQWSEVSEELWTGWKDLEHQELQQLKQNVASNC